MYSPVAITPTTPMSVISLNQLVTNITDTYNKTTKAAGRVLAFGDFNTNVYNGTDFPLEAKPLPDITQVFIDALQLDFQVTEDGIYRILVSVNVLTDIGTSGSPNVLFRNDPVSSLVDPTVTAIDPFYNNSFASYSCYFPDCEGTTHNSLPQVYVADIYMAAGQQNSIKVLVSNGTLTSTKAAINNNTGRYPHGCWSVAYKVG